MCGRAAQTVHAVHAVAASFGVLPTATHVSNKESKTGSSSSATQRDGRNIDPTSGPFNTVKTDKDNYNLSPGMDAAVIWMDKGELKMERKVWGLVTKGGTSQHPLPSDNKTRMGMHFSGLMYNARADTLFQKPTFSRLAHQGKSCLVALDGYFEWKVSLLAGGKGKKQPYFVYRRGSEDSGQKTLLDSSVGPEHPFLLMAGLWTSVPTGLADDPTLESFTILTTDACSQIAWLHHRMPVCIWDMELARKWLQDPSPAVHREIDTAAIRNNDGFAWHAVTTEMSSVKFRGKEAILPTKTPKSVTAFFTKAGGSLSIPAKTTPVATYCDMDQNLAEKSNIGDRVEKSETVENLDNSQPHKRISSPLSKNLSKKARIHPPDSPKKGLITSFFQKKG